MTDEEREQEFRHFDERRERYIAEQTALTVDQVRVALDAGEWRFLMEHPGNIDAASRLKDASDEERAEYTKRFEERRERYVAEQTGLSLDQVRGVLNAAMIFLTTTQATWMW